MRGFEFSTPLTVAQAAELLAMPGAVPLAGGTDLLIHIRAGVKSPRHLVDLSGLGLSYVCQDNGLVKIGAMTTFQEILESDIVRRDLACLAESAAEIGAVQTRNMATVGGNICSAVPSADSAPPLLVLDAQVKLAGCQGERVLPLNRFFSGPKKNVLQPGEFLVEIQVPVPPARTGTRFLKIGRRKAMTLAVVNAAARVSLAADARGIENVRIAMGAVAPVPMRAEKAEGILRGREPSEASFERAAELAAEEIAPIGDLRASAAYRRQVTQVLVKRSLIQAWQRAEESA